MRGNTYEAVATPLFSRELWCSVFDVLQGKKKKNKILLLSQALLKILESQSRD